MSTTHDIPLRFADTRIARIDQQIEELAASRGDAIAELISDLEWQDIPFVYAVVVGKVLEPNFLVHVNETHYKLDGVEKFGRAHMVEHCNGHWCRKVGELRWSRGKNAVGWRHLGTYRAVVADDRGLWICVPE
jgi:hypothetical protein